jgi:dihydroceramidase
MHLLTTPLIYRLLTFKASPQHTQLIAILLSTLFTVVMVTHMVMDEFLLHASSFGLGVYVIVHRITNLIPEQVPDPKVRRNIHNIANIGLGKLLSTLRTHLRHAAKPCHV